jgi:hypothetical protein
MPPVRGRCWNLAQNTRSYLALIGIPLLKMQCGSGFQPRISAEMQNNNTSADYTDSHRLLINIINISFLICAICLICG